MAIIRWEPLSDIDKWFEDSLTPFSKSDWSDLSADVYEKDGNVVAELTLSGVDPDKVDVDVKDGFLTVSGSRDEDKEDKGKNYYSRRIVRGSFEKRIHLPTDVDVKKAKAEYDKGMLKITLPLKKAEEVGNKIKVEVKK